MSFDIDALTFENCPHTGTPVSGGLTFNQAVWLLDTLTRSGRRIIGFDVVEVCPAPDERIDAITGARHALETLRADPQVKRIIKRPI